MFSQIMQLRKACLAAFFALALLCGDASGQNVIVEDWEAQQERFAKDGVAFQISYTGAMMDHLGGGFRHGTNWQGLLDVGMLVDLEKLMGWDGATFHAEGFWVQGNSPSSLDYIGNINEVSNIAAIAATARIYHLWLQQKFLDDRLRMNLGWMTLDTDFMNSASAGLFINSAYGPIQTWNMNFAAPVYPVAALGLLTEWQVNDQYELQLGFYDGDAGGELGNKHSSNTRLGSDDGVAILLEGARTHSIAGRAGTLKVGAGWNTGLTPVNATGELVHGNGHAYAMMDQTLLPGQGKLAPDRLTFFTRIGQVFHPGRSMVDFTLDLGFIGGGLRKTDQWGVAMTHSHMSRSFVMAVEAGGGASTSAETALELTYKAQVTPWLALQPTLQHIMNPQGGKPDATVAGLVMTLAF